MGETYAASGVDIEAGDAAVSAIGGLVESTKRPEVIGGIGGFGGLFDVSDLSYDEPVLVSATDGVGTKALVATATGSYDTIGLDLVAMCVDDLVCGGAEPLFFLDYISVGKVAPETVEALVSGIADGCRQVGAALIGGEIAEHAGVMEEGEFDLVGFATGVVERKRAQRPPAAQPGDALIGLASPGLRSNGYTLARRIMFDVAGRSIDDPAWEGASSTVGEELLVPSVIYTPTILEMQRAVDVRGVAHITGGGIAGNLPRSLPPTVGVRIDSGSWTPPQIFTELQRLGQVANDEMAKVFNMGVGMIVVVPADQVDQALDTASAADPWVIGEVSHTAGEVRFE